MYFVETAVMKKKKKKKMVANIKMYENFDLGVYFKISNK